MSVDQPDATADPTPDVYLDAATRYIQAGGWHDPDGLDAETVAARPAFRAAVGPLAERIADLEAALAHKVDVSTIYGYELGAGDLAGAEADLARANAALDAVRALALGWIHDGPDGAPRVLAERVLAAADPQPAADRAGTAAPIAYVWHSSDGDHVLHPSEISVLYADPAATPDAQ